MALADLIDPGTLDAVVISHVHVDHCSDLFGLYGFLAFGPGGQVPVKVFIPEDGAAHMAAFARATGEHIFNNVLDFEEVGTGSTAQVGDLELRFGEAIHPVPAVVTRIDADGASLVYSGDTGPGGDLIELATGCDLLLCEASIQGVRTEQTYPYHLTAIEAGEIASWSGANELVLTHIGALLDPEMSLEEASGAYAGPIAYAAPTTTFTIN